MVLGGLACTIFCTGILYITVAGVSRGDFTEPTGVLPALFRAGIPGGLVIAALGMILGMWAYGTGLLPKECDATR